MQLDELNKGEYTTFGQYRFRTFKAFIANNRIYKDQQIKQLIEVTKIGPNRSNVGSA